MPTKKALPRKARVKTSPVEDIGDYSPALLRKLERAVKDIEDPRRYVIKGAPHPAMPWEVFYDVSVGAFCTGIEHATLFKQKKIAMAVAGLLRIPSRIEEVQYKRGEPIVRSRKPAGPRSRATSPQRTKRRR
jgi:hypothetical protein